MNGDRPQEPDKDADGVPMATDPVKQLSAAIRELPEATWPGGYGELGLAILDSIWSISANYDSHVRPLIERYRKEHPGADRHTASDLAAAISAAGGPEGFASGPGNRQRTSTRNGVLKAEAVAEAAAALLALDIATADDLRKALTSERADAVKDAWLGVKGQRSGISWRYLLMLLGVPGVKADRMIVRFVERSLCRSVRPPEAAALVEAAAIELGISATDADHRIWAHERARR